jgi:hypothetical protein
VQHRHLQRVILLCRTDVLEQRACGAFIVISIAHHEQALITASPTEQLLELPERAPAWLRDVDHEHLAIIEQDTDTVLPQFVTAAELVDAIPTVRPFFVNQRGTAIPDQTVRSNFGALCKRAWYSPP